MGTDAPMVVEGELPPMTSSVSADGLGRYVAIEEVGSGAMGRVLRAYDPKLQREVALKVLRAQVMPRDAARALVLEARAMAKLSHPNVVSVFDVDAVGQDVVLVMEYVRGETLRAWLHEESRSWADVVAHFTAAGRGLAAAHAQGILHRDFKPANVLLGVDGTVKVSDFGIADVAHEGASTTMGVVAGTPRYMAPEQHRGEPMGAAADQYAFCVALWEALVGTPPFSGGRLAERKQAGPPPWPSQSAVPRRLVATIARGLAPDPGERWPSMDAFLDELRPAPGWLRPRNAVVVGLVAAIGATTWGGHSWAQAQAQRCSGARSQLADVWNSAVRAEVEAAIVEGDVPFAPTVWANVGPQLDAYGEEWSTTHTEACEATSVRGERTTALMDLQMACLQRAKVGFGAALDVLRRSETETLLNAHEVVAGLPALSRCSDLEGLASDVAPPDDSQAEAVARARQALAEGGALRQAGRPAEAEAALDRADEELASTTYPPVRNELSLARGMLLEKLGDYEASAQALDDAIVGASAAGQWDVARDAATRQMFVVGFRQARMTDALAYATIARGLVERSGELRAEGDFHRTLATVLYKQGAYQGALRELRTALRAQERVLAPDHPDMATAHITLAIVYNGMGRYEDAESEARRMVELRTATLGPEHPDTAGAIDNLANSVFEQGRYEEAERLMRRSLSIHLKILGPDHPQVALCRNNLAGALIMRGKIAEAEEELRRALKVREEVLGPEHPLVADTLYNLTTVLDDQGHHEEAAAGRRRVIALMEKRLGPDHAELAMPHYSLGLSLVALGRYDEGEAEYRRALRLSERALGRDHPMVAMVTTVLSETLLDRDRASEAVPLAERAWAIRQREDISASRRADSAFVLARALQATGQSPERTRELAETAAAIYADADPPRTGKRDEVLAWLRAIASISPSPTAKPRSRPRGPRDRPR